MVGVLFEVQPRGVVCGDVAKRHGRPQRDAACRVMATHDAVQVVAAGIQTGDGVALGIEHLGVRVGAQTGKGAQAAHDHFHGVKRPAFKGGHAGVAQTQALAALRVALHAVVGGLTFAEVGVFAAEAQPVVALHTGLQRFGGQAALRGQCCQRLAALQIAIFQPWPQRHGRRFDRP